MVSVYLYISDKKLIQSIRDCPKIKKVVYISCKPLGNVLRNFVE
jgi:hypothetical protein